MADRSGIGRSFGLSGNQLKILALVAMTCDHVGKQLLPQYPVLQIIGRVAFPIFAYLIAEGCRYTRSRRRYLGGMALLALGCQAVYYIAMGSLYQCVLVSFSMAIGLIFLLEHGRQRGTWGAWSAAALGFALTAVICVCLPRWWTGTDFAIDYGLWGVLLPVAVYLGRDRWQKLALTAMLVLSGCFVMGGIQWYALLSLPLLALYNGRRGKYRLKYLFYIYYPLHLGAIYLISIIL